ncbi:MAG: hypothetical protein ABR551_09340 [Gemmatimonadales bacterium]
MPAPLRSTVVVAGLVLATSAGIAACGGGESPPPYTPPALEARLATLLAGGFTVDASPIGGRLHGEIVPASSHDPEQLPVLNGAPAHLRFAFDDAVLPAAVNYRNQQVLVYSLAEYRSHFIGGARAGFDRRIGALRAIIRDTAAPIEGEIPVFPQVDADQRFRARVRWISFDGGRGIAFVTQYSKDASPPGPDDLAWVFQGLTDDDRWLVAVFHPIHATGVPASEDPRRVAGALDTLPPDAFHPDPAVLAQMAATIRFAPDPSPNPRRP